MVKLAIAEPQYDSDSNDDDSYYLPYKLETPAAKHVLLHFRTCCLHLLPICHMQASQQRKPDAALSAQLAEKTVEVEQIMAEGERLSVKILEHENTIKRLKAKIKVGVAQGKEKKRKQPRFTPVFL